MCCPCCTPEAKIRHERRSWARADDLGAGGRHQAVLVHQVLDLAGHELAAADVQLARVGLLLAGLA